MKKVITAVIVVILIFTGIYFVYEYVTEPKIVDGVVAKSIGDEGSPIDVTTIFAPEDTVYFAAKQNRLWIKKAQVVWYKGEIAPENRLLVVEEVIVNDGKYFTAELSVPEGLEEGHYGVTIYVKGSKIMEAKAEFDVKK